MTTSVSNAEVIKQQIDAINGHDVARFATLYSSDAIVLDPQYPAPLSGRAEVERDMADFLKALPDLRAQLTRTLVEGSTHAAELTMSGTNTGPLALPSGTVPATNRRLEFHLAVFGRVNSNGEVVEERRYYDIADQLRQLGLGG
jgi:steroid delta-isomerase-like uncharacterized protein